MTDIGVVVIDPVSDSDTGEYWCIWQSNENMVTTAKMQFWAIPLTGYIGGEVEMKLVYGFGYENKGKCVQKLGHPTPLIYTQNGQPRANNAEKCFLYDNTRTKELTLTIRGLGAEDSGKYMFGIFDFRFFPEWPLEVKALINVSNYEGRNIKIPCKSQTTKSMAYRKHVCRGSDPGECLVQGALNDRFSLEDNVAEKVFIVSIYNLRAEDSGIYWCVEFTDRGPEFTSAIQLTVKKFSPQTDSGSDSPQTDSPQTPSGSDTNSAIWVLVPVVVLLLLGIGLLVVVKYKKKKSEQPPNLPGNQMSTDTARTRKETVDYENDVVHARRKTRANPPTPPNSDPEYQNSDTSAVPLYLAVIPTSTESAPTNQTLDNKTGRQSVATSQTLNVNPCQKVFVCHTPHLSTSLNIPTYQQLNPNTNQGDSGYMSL
ncbi:hypothetical protein AALO_G00095890 [Alosa alosa]|uniref:Immunoglobulin V-set domain-containing protein n=2 Tax=Alosa alosa TaxID=278164 RepID=A0AAV6GSJ5_9TELE|nr:hypothetical protein AALO_G00095890 [Alosa alosa]